MTDETALAEPVPGLPEALTRKPIIDLLHEDQVKLLAARAQAGSKGEIKRGELAAFLELAASYQLDPFAGEVWLAKGSNDKVLIMVGRDGLRKIAQRSGLYVDGDVIHEKDEFQTRRLAGGAREIVHQYGHPSQRGEIVAAWCEVKNEAGLSVGFFVATVEEYAPTNDKVLQYSPWGSQRSVMILAAAERQALRQATPLSGLVAQGELDRAQEAEAAIPLDVDGPLHDDPEVAERAEALLTKATNRGHAGYADRGTAAMALRGQSFTRAMTWLDNAERELRAQEPADAEVAGGDDDDPIPGDLSEQQGALAVDE